MAKGRGVTNSSPALGNGESIPVEEKQIFDIVLPVTISTTPAYVAGDALGGLLTFVNAALEVGGSGTITSVTILDEDQELSPVDLVLFNQTFTATADNAPFDPSDADLANCIGYIDIPATDYADFVDNSVASKASGLRMPKDYVLVGTSLFGQMVIRDGATYTAVDDVTIKITVERK